MAKGDKPVAVAREQNISVTVWENPKKSGDGTYKTITIDVSRPTKETKELPKEQREYVHTKTSIQYRQLNVLKGLLDQITEKEE